MIYNARLYQIQRVWYGVPQGSVLGCSSPFIPLMGVAKGGSWDPPNPPVRFFIKDGVVYEVYCTQYAFYAHQRWSPRRSSRPFDHVLGLGFQVLGLGLVLRPSVLGLGNCPYIGLEHSNFLATNPDPLPFSQVSRST